MLFQRLPQWGFGQQGQPFIIAGPCSAETEEQVIDTCLQLAQQGVHALRAGIWKPRTRPNSFEGVGEEGLPWLRAAAQATGLPVCTEVANAQHVEKALRYGIDFLWIGARTTVNPFAVQEIADALRGVDIPVLVKNPVNPDLELWLGALERLYQAGLQKLAAVHRGFSIYKSVKYRNQPQWEIPIELRRRYPDLDLLLDPSHIAGHRDLLLELAQKGMDLGYNGLMIESHRQPAAAWSDAQQQLTPAALGDLLQQLVLRQPQTQDPLVAIQLQHYRDQIDQIDFQWLDLLAQRMELVRQIGSFKRDNHITILQLQRWEEILRTRMAAALPRQLSAAFIEQLLHVIHNESIRQQVEIMKTAESSTDPLHCR